MNILLTGGAGFIGSCLSKALLKEPGNRVTILDNFDDFYPRAIKDLNIAAFKNNPTARFIEADVVRLEEYAEKLDDKYDVIIHLAAKAGVRPSIQNPFLYNQVNILGTQSLLDLAIKKNIPKFIFAGSSSVYGVNPSVPWNEEMHLMPISPYASTKLAGEQLGYVYNHLYGLNFIALRFFTVYGPAQRPDLAIHKFFKAIEINKPIPVFGDGSTRRDYTFIDDLVKGIVAAISYDQTSYEIINLGHNEPVQLNDLIKLIEKVSGKKAIRDHQPEQPGDVPQTYADITKAMKLLEYSPSTSLEQGLESFYQWFLKHKDILINA